LGEEPCVELEVLALFVELAVALLLGAAGLLPGAAGWVAWAGAAVDEVLAVAGDELASAALDEGLAAAGWDDELTAACWDEALATAALDEEPAAAAWDEELATALDLAGGAALLGVGAAPVAVTGAPTGLPVCVGEEPVYA